MLSTALRSSLRQASRPSFRVRPQQRFSSTSTSNTSASAEAAQKKAQDAFAQAQAAGEKLWRGAKKALGPVGERVGEMLGSYKTPLTYNLSVAREVLKQIYHAERLAPPSLATLREAYVHIWSSVSSPAALRSFATSGQVAQVGVYGLQAYGVFKIGEIIGRRSLVGYDVPVAHH